MDRLWMTATVDTGSANNSPDLGRCIAAIEGRARIIRLEMKKIWNSGDLKQLDRYQLLNESLRQLNQFKAEFEWRKNLL